VAYYLFNYTRKGADKSRSLREQAAQLLDARLWGIGDKTQHRNSLAAGDRIVAYVGAPERSFIGHATLASGVHTWTSDEARRYPGAWSAGVAFSDATVWQNPVALASVWRDLPSSESNPAAHFFGGVVRIKEADFERLLAEREAKPLQRATTPDATSAPTSRDKPVDRLYAVTERLRAFLSAASRPSLTEEATRAHFIDKYLTALGYTDFADIEYGVRVESGDLADYVLLAQGRPAVVVEAKRLGAPLGAKEAAQVVKYASVLGVRWGVLTDGRFLKLYDPRVPDVTPENRLVFELDLAGYQDREDFEVRIFDADLALLSREAIAGGGLERRAAKEALRELLTDVSSAAVRALQSELRNKKLIQLGIAELTDLLAELLD
jgi:predicted type IV restriction endonuclease